MAKRWEKMIDDKDMIVYGDPRSKKVFMAEKWEKGWAIDKAVDETPPEDFGKWRFENRETNQTFGIS